LKTILCDGTNEWTCYYVRVQMDEAISDT
jgi:hypothetical protein